MIIKREHVTYPFMHLNVSQEKCLIVPKSYTQIQIKQFIGDNEEEINKILCKYSSIVHATKRVCSMDNEDLNEIFDDCWATFSAKTGLTNRPSFVIENMKTLGMKTLGRYNRATNTIFLNELIGKMCVSYTHVAQTIIHEMCHMVYSGHDDNFKGLLRKFYKNYKRLSEEQSYAIKSRMKG